MLETQKLELLAEISSLKLKLTSADRENKESEVTHASLEIKSVESAFSFFFYKVSYIL